MRDVHVFVDDDAHRRAIGEPEFGGTAAQGGAQHRVQPRHRPIGHQGGGDHLINCGLLGGDGADDTAEQRHIGIRHPAIGVAVLVFVATEAVMDEFLDHALGIQAGGFRLEQRLHRGEAGGGARALAVGFAAGH